MTSHRPIIVDTCVWIPFLNKGAGRAQTPLAKLLEQDRIQIIGPILQEILIGIRRREQARWVASQLDGLVWIDLIRDDYIEASDLGRELAKNNHILPSADLQIAAVTTRTGSLLWTTDPHFDLIPDISRFDPNR